MHLARQGEVENVVSVQANANAVGVKRSGRNYKVNGSIETESRRGNLSGIKDRGVNSIEFALFLFLKKD